MLHASLVGHFGQHLNFILEHPEPAGHFLRLFFADLVTDCLSDKLDMSDANSNVVMLTLKLYHSRQAGFTDTELDKLGDFFSEVPASAASEAIPSAGTPLIMVCEPVWQLISPAGTVFRVYWGADPEVIDPVAKFSELT